MLAQPLGMGNAMSLGNFSVENKYKAGQNYSVQLF